MKIKVEKKYSYAHINQYNDCRLWGIGQFHNIFCRFAQRLIFLVCFWQNRTAKPTMQINKNTASKQFHSKHFLSCILNKLRRVLRLFFVVYNLNLPCQVLLGNSISAIKYLAQICCCCFLSFIFTFSSSGSWSYRGLRITELYI